jgi:transcriptional regulator with XRE-family HTH domain
MTLQLERSSNEGTSAGDTASPRILGGIVLVASLWLFGPGTSTDAADQVDATVTAECLAQETTAGISPAPAEDHAAAVQELRALSGLSWEQLARLFGVSRRAAHLWATGKAMNPVNEEHLYRCLAVVRRADRGGSAFNRTALLRADEAGELPFDLLVAGQYNLAAVQLLSSAPHRVIHRPFPVHVSADRLPPPPAELLGALHGKVHRDLPGGRTAKSVKVPRERNG